MLGADDSGTLTAGSDTGGATLALPLERFQESTKN